MLRAGLGGVTARARLAGAAAVRLVAAGAVSMPLRRATVLRLMTRRAVCAARAGVRLVATRTIAVSGRCASLLWSVARLAAIQQCFGAMRQPAVAARASLMTGVARDLLHSLGVAVLARGAAGELDHEVVRLVALNAVYARVAGVIARRKLVTAAAASGPTRGVPGGGMGIVTAHATAGASWMIWMHGRVATRASLFWGRLDRVRKVTVVARLMR